MYSYFLSSYLKEKEPLGNLRGVRDFIDFSGSLFHYFVRPAFMLVDIFNGIGVRRIVNIKMTGSTEYFSNN